ncbi:hypothetical protein GE09DRAFT_971778 [Coniochaeta sp. 2T2.1]|nr:hypothetical protein GE09DRAFT_971778 [Coniochaeta sp. 2T2.1]
MVATPSSTKRSIRPHRKSRNGCSSCKRRKVKCDECKPCGNCKSFGLPCELDPQIDKANVPVIYCTAPSKPRGRGRPRKLWSAAITPPASVSPLSSTTPAADNPEVESPPDSDADTVSIDLDNAELLLHFITKTAGTLAGENPAIQRFWTQSAPLIGLSHAYVLQLIFALSALHIAHDSESDGADNGGLHPPRKEASHYRSLAQRHLNAGLSGFTAELSRAGPDNCGALYLGATLTTYCTFASGPTNEDDLLVCTADGAGAEDATMPAASSSSWMPFVYGVRLMRQSFSEEQLFTGPMAVFRPGAPEQCPRRPVRARNGIDRVDWEDALGRLRAFITGGSTGENGDDGEMVSDTSRRDVCLKALDDLIDIYIATYGRRNTDGGEAQVPPEKQFVFGWLYHIKREFVARVRRREPEALLVLAYYAVLLNGDGVPDGWYVKGWRKHIVSRIADLFVDEEIRALMLWPMNQV